MHWQAGSDLCKVKEKVGCFPAWLGAGTSCDFYFITHSKAAVSGCQLGALSELACISLMLHPSEITGHIRLSE